MDGRIGMSNWEGIMENWELRMSLLELLDKLDLYDNTAKDLAMWNSFCFEGIAYGYEG